MVSPFAVQASGIPFNLVAVILNLASSIFDGVDAGHRIGGSERALKYVGGDRFDRFNASSALPTVATVCALL